MATPDLTPAFDIAIEEPGSHEATSLDLSGRCISFAFEDHANMADEMLLTLDNSDLALFDDPRFRMNQRLNVSWGYRGRMTNKRRCVIVGMRGSTTIEIKAHGEAIKLDQVPHPRCFENMSHSAIVRKIAQEHGFGGSEFIEETRVVHPTVVQPAISDGKFLRRLAQLNRFEFFVKGGVLHFHSPKLEQTPKKTLIYRTDGTGRIVDFQIEEERHGVRGGVKAKGINPMSKKPYEVKGSNAETRRPGIGKCIVNVDQQTQQVGAPPECVDEEVVPSSARTQEEAKQHADGKFRESQKRIKLTMTIVGDPDIVARDLVVVEGIGRRFSGRWYIKQVNTKIEGACAMALQLSRDGHNGYGDHKDLKSKANQNKKEPESDPSKAEGYRVERETQQVDEKATSVTAWRKPG